MNLKVTLNLFALVCILIFTQCSVDSSTTYESNVDVDQLKMDLMETDRAFSNKSGSDGMGASFLEYCGDDATLLRPNSMPIEGIDAIREHYSGSDSSNMTVGWEPLFASVSKGGDMGYTYGTFSYTVDSISGEGTYVSIWEMDDEGNWKVVMDSGNEGLKKKEKSDM